MAKRRKLIHSYPWPGYVAIVWILALDFFTKISLGSISLSGIITIATAILCVIVWPTSFLLRSGTLRSDISRNSGKQTLLLLFALMSLGWLFFVHSTEALQNVSVYISFVMVTYLGSTLFVNADVEGFIRSMRNAALLSTIIFLVSHVAGFSTYGDRSFALAGLIYLALMIPYKPTSLIERMGPYLVIFALVISLSRTATIIGIIMMVFLSVRGTRRFRSARMISVFLLSGLSLYLLISSYAPFRDRFLIGDNAASFDGVEISTSGRAVLWDITLQSWKENPLFGQGPGTASRLISSIFVNISHPHNDYLRILHDFGLVGLALFCFGYISIALSVWNRARRTDHPVHWSALIGLLGVAAAASTDNVFVYPFVMVPLGVIVGASLSLDASGSESKRSLFSNRFPGRFPI